VSVVSLYLQVAIEVARTNECPRLSLDTRIRQREDVRGTLNGQVRGRILEHLKGADSLTIFAT
jgi:hypothetical protein